MGSWSDAKYTFHGSGECRWHTLLICVSMSHYLMYYNVLILCPVIGLLSHHLTTHCMRCILGIMPCERTHLTFEYIYYLDFWQLVDEEHALVIDPKMLACHSGCVFSIASVGCQCVVHSGADSPQGSQDVSPCCILWALCIPYRVYRFVSRAIVSVP